MANFKGESFAGYNPAQARGTSDTTTGSKYFFDKLKAISEEKANQIVAERADLMYNVLRFRKQLAGGYGVYPKWQPDPANKKERSIKSKESYKEWHKEIMPTGNIRVFNTMNADIGDFAYPLLLLHGPSQGRTWGFMYKQTTLPSDRVNSAGFSTQMPEGIQPWLDGQAKILKEKLRDEFHSITGKIK